MTPQDLRTEFQAGKSLAQVAEAKGVTRDTLKAKLARDAEGAPRRSRRGWHG